MRLPRTLRSSPARRAVALLLLSLAACRAAGAAPRANAAGAGREEQPVLLDEASLTNFRALNGALESGNDELARRLVANLRARPLGAREEELVASAERVLTGRELVRGLELGLASEAVDEAAGRYRLLLVGRSAAATPVTLRLPPADLKRLTASMNERGVEGLDYESKVSPALRALVLPPGTERRVVLLEYELPLGRALAVRERWRLETRSGEIERDGAHYPAANVGVAACERERLSPLLPAEPLPPETLAERLRVPQAPSVREFLALALRVPRAERPRALRALAPELARLAREAPERMARIEPALRWLTQNRELGADAAAWARYLETRGERAEGAEPRDDLDLPERPRAAAGAR